MLILISAWEFVGEVSPLAQQEIPRDKAWYVQMGLGKRLDADLPGEQVVVQLNFEPKGVGIFDAM